jgi:hypothetical protein
MPERKRKRTTAKQAAAQRLFTRRVRAAQAYRKTHPHATMASAMRAVSR